MCRTNELGTAHSLSIHDLDYGLPQELIAQYPPARRDDARLLVVDRDSSSLADRYVTDLPQLLQPGDLLVLNDTKVLPAKFTAWRETGGRVGGLFLREESAGLWEVMLVGSRRLRAGETLAIRLSDEREMGLELVEDLGQGQWRVRVERDGPAEAVLDEVGVTPLPPYIRRKDDDVDLDAADRRRYQTVYAHRPGAIAAPTAGLHFTPVILKALEAAGVQVAFVTLHVGVGTFKPISAERVAEHVMHSEWYELSAKTAEAVRACRDRGGSVVAVGTTSVRVLESAAGNGDSRTVVPGSGRTELFIYPPHKFRVVDKLMTNFHLPRSSLLALVMAFAGMDQTRQAYQHAIDDRYRFFSYGDAMLIR